MEASDGDRWATALREMEEEVGVSPAAIQRLGVIDEYRTITRYHVTPCVGLLSPDAVFSPSADEVEEVFTIPVSTFRDPARIRTMRSTRGGHAERIWFFLTSPHVVWGATAAMLRNLLTVLEPTAE